MLKNFMIIIINGASGAGKTYLLQQLKKINDDFVPIKKYTTRSVRSFENKEDSVDLVYNFSRDDIKKHKYNYEYKKEHYAIDDFELKEIIGQGKAPVVIIRDFDTIRKIKKDFSDVIVLFVIGETGQELNKRLVSQGRDKKDINVTEGLEKIIKEYVYNIDLINHCLINSLYDKDLYLKQFFCYVNKYSKG